MPLLFTRNDNGNKQHGHDINISYHVASAVAVSQDINVDKFPTLSSSQRT